jgi:hypothetical protein
MHSVSTNEDQAVKLYFVSTSAPAHCHREKFSAGPSWNLWASGQRDYRQKLDECWPYAPLLVSFYEGRKPNELSILSDLSGSAVFEEFFEYGA